MKIDNKVTITFNEEEIKGLIKEKVEAEGYKVIDIKLNINKNQWAEGHGFGEIDYEKLILQNVEVVAEKKQIPKTVKNDDDFYQNIEGQDYWNGR